MKNLLPVAAAMICLAGTVPANATRQESTLADTVHRIDWTRFEKDMSPNPEAELSARILANSTRAARRWISDTFRENAEGDRYLVPNRNAEPAIRPATSAALGLAVAIRTGVTRAHDDLPTVELTQQAVKLIKGAAAVHKANGGQWGDHWQSSLWAAQLGRAAWMLWDDLDNDTREWVCRAVAHEADRHIQPDYTVPYWNGQGGDSKAEENSWEAMVLQQAVAMLPDHPHAGRWKQICSELQISAFSRPSDRDRTGPVLDGRSPGDWLRGYNLREDGVVINHGLIHNDYMTSFAHLQMSGFLVSSLAGTPVPETTDFNFALVYGALVTNRFASPPFEPPGGTMYIPGSAEQYYPQGTDWSRLRYACYLGMDTIADVLGYDAGLPHRAAHWRELRARRILQMQARHADGRLYADDEFTSYPSREQMVFWMVGDAHLFQWLADRHALAKKANWLAR